jgi:Ino eighty subunit 1
MDTAAAARAEEPDSRNSLRHILAAEPPMDDARQSPSQADTPAPDDSARLLHVDDDDDAPQRQWQRVVGVQRQ